MTLGHTPAVPSEDVGELSDGARMPEHQPSRAYHVRVGDVVVTALNDSYLPFPADAMTALSDADRLELNDRSRQPDPHVAVNAFLITRAGRRTLVDTGCGADTAPEPGVLMEALRSIGVGPEDISAVLMTHLHSDHVGGLTNVDGSAAFPNAEIVLHEAEIEFWLNDPPARTDGPLLEHFSAAARAQPLRSRMRAVTDGEVLPGIHILPEPGHTPGHSGYVIDSGNQQLLIWGDIVHQPQLQFARPEAGVIWDVDHEGAAATRTRMFDRVASDNLYVAGMHLGFHPFGYVVKERGRYTFVRKAWSPTV
jgi:glyoxylase-like metal-dependent hydrolase (beta-lactamase superfamily II)